MHEKFWFLSNPNEDAMRPSLCLCFNSSKSEYLLSLSVGYYRFEVEKEQCPVTWMGFLIYFKHVRLWDVVQCCSQGDVIILQTVLKTKNPLVQIYYVSLKV